MKSLEKHATVAVLQGKEPAFTGVVLNGNVRSWVNVGRKYVNIRDISYSEHSPFWTRPGMPRASGPLITSKVSRTHVCPNPVNDCASHFGQKMKKIISRWMKGKDLGWNTIGYCNIPLFPMPEMDWNLIPSLLSWKEMTGHHSHWWRMPSGVLSLFGDSTYNTTFLLGMLVLVIPI